MLLASVLKTEQRNELISFYEKLDDQLPQAIHERVENLFKTTSIDINAFHQCVYCSEYIQGIVLQHPTWLVNISETLLNHNFSVQAHFQTLRDSCTELDDLDFDREIRELRAQAMFRIIWRNANRLASLQETTAELSSIADLAVQIACRYHREKLVKRFGQPCNSSGEQQAFLVLGMGKLGAYELNLSSDIDLIFAFPESGSTHGSNAQSTDYQSGSSHSANMGATNSPSSNTGSSHSRSDSTPSTYSRDNSARGHSKSIDNQEFFSRLGKGIIRSLDARNASGFVFRVDMRLRPYGESGALVSNFTALEDYYQNQGREWERYAMIKARVISNDGDSRHTDALMTMLRSFTYRKYVDFSVIDSLRELKAMIREEVRRRKLEDDVKLGAGGIREIEFIAQVFQLIRGGRDSELQDNRIHTILPLLEDLACLPKGCGTRLLEAYTFLRNSEHAIQAWQDRQTQKLPENDAAKNALIRSMNCHNWGDYCAHLEQHRSFVKYEFSQLIAPIHDNTDTDENSNDTKFSDLWRQCLSSKDEGINCSKLENQLYEFAQQSSIQSLTSQSRNRLDTFIPILLERISGRLNPELCLERILPLIKAVARRSAYLILLIENPGALKRLLELSESSAWIAAELAKQPALLDELLDPRQLFLAPETEELETELRRLSLGLDIDDLERQMDMLRYFRSSHALRVAACEASDSMPLMKVSDYLSAIAETVLRYALTLCWKLMVARHGYPDGLERDEPEFLILGYGKLGGLEMNHGSDLDLVFVHNAQPNGYSDGKRSIDNQTFYVRLGQKIIHLLDTNTSSGRLYEVDMRLRPSGNKGLLSTSLIAFEKYQQNEAWTWEHQALVRARVVAGDAKIAKVVLALRHKILCTPRDDNTLKKDISDMRLKMRAHLGTVEKEQKRLFHIKQDAGGIVDIEFMVQYAVLAWAHKVPALTDFTDNIRILECLALHRILPEQDVQQLSSAYIALRIASHRLTIEHLPSTISADQFTQERELVIAIWNRLLS